MFYFYLAPASILILAAASDSLRLHILQNFFHAAFFLI